ncbi:MAG: 4'-phosphopantetheinyl transferase superfamily protein [Alphaproteobacteria bacterium]|nr:4'-phosphopantetheinyl transferase superfamily protein [Alphaproteobacteria bacterium]
MKSISLTYKTLLPLQWKNLSLEAGFCLSHVSFQNLKEDPSSFLHPLEEAYFSGLSHPRRQHSYLLGRYCAKQAIKAYCNDVDLKDIAIESGIFDHPVVTYMPGSPLQVSISHTDTLGTALAFPEIHPMAIDVEAICPSKADAIKSQLSPAEQKLWFYLRKEKSDEATQLTVLWTVKEALSKALKCGLTVPFEVLEIEIIREQEGFVISTFKNFKQYQALSFCLDAHVCSIVYPIHTSFKIDVENIKKNLQERYP